MLKALFRWLGRVTDRRRMPTRLTEQEAVEIARRTVSEEATRQSLVWATAKASEGRVVWQVSQPATGSGYFVEIDDASGEVIKTGRWGVR